MKKKFIIGGVLLFALLTLVLIIANALNPRDSIHQAAHPYSFDLFQWEVRNLPDKWLKELRGLPYKKMSTAEEDAYVRRYFALVAEINSLTREIQSLESGAASQGTTSQDALKARLRLLEQERGSLKDNVEQSLEHRVAEAMVSEGLALTLFKASLLFPPMDFKFNPLPMVLITSPRERIELKDSILLRPDTTLEDIEKLERAAEGQGLSALVEGVGGFSTYPSIVPSSASLSFTLNTIAHEWLHQYLFFRPLGRHYWDNYSMITINETTADIVGEEISSRMLDKYGDAWGEAKAPPRVQPDGGQDFFSQQMHQIRLRVDELLSQGSVEEAERYMEEQRRLLAQKGYYIRRLNQAYFAFHGSYGTSPASSSPIGGELRQLRRESASLGEFIKKVSSISSHEQLESLLKK